MKLFRSRRLDEIVSRIALNSVPVDGQYWYEATRWKKTAHERAAGPEGASPQRQPQPCAAC
ncbi:MAG TPA: hypothetical protein VIL32_12255 [Steroidobacteraceae bacterium]